MTFETWVGWPTLIYGIRQPKFEFWVVNLGLGWPTLIYGFRQPKFRFGMANLGLGWPTLIYGFCQPKFEFGVANLGFESWVGVGQTSNLDFANPNSRSGCRTLVWKLYFGVANLHIRISSNQAQVWGGEVGFGMANPLIRICQPKFEFGMANLRLGWPTLLYGFRQHMFE